MASCRQVPEQEAERVDQVGAFYPNYVLPPERPHLTILLILSKRATPW